MRKIILLSLAFGTNLIAEPIPENLSQNGWFIGAQAYTFKEFSAFEAVAKTKEAGGNMIEFYPGQILKPGSKEKIHHTMSAESMAELKAECARVGVRPVNYGVVAAKDAAEVRSIMEFAKKMELYCHLYGIRRANRRLGSRGEGIRYSRGLSRARRFDEKPEIQGVEPALHPRRRREP